MREIAEPFALAQDRLRRMDQDDNGGMSWDDKGVQVESWLCEFAVC